ncbi:MULTISPECIES: porin family protein [unclassified Bacteroides]|jgi:hypothetical protein|uniref:porin family protein n=1 Tax=unclassified Bacteroides TaxID=2646097 RepID=UPI000E95D26E|nr:MULTISPECIES: porin family protein [unclassified Bacteroides]RGN45744.1 PorT family protein [Bacteroides sp. OM05-12]RHR73928.1 PorT family protein [Bacteroides sp. AF16-49]
MRKSLLLLIYLFVCLSSYSQNDPVNKEKNFHVNVGIKGGFNSSMYFVDKFKIKDVTIHEIQNNYRVGYFGSIFMRINMRRHFIQPEINYTISKSDIQFDKKGSQHPDIEPDYANISSTIRMVELPILYGYNFIKSGPYEMHFFVGPNIKYVWQQKSKLRFNNFDQQGIEEDLYPINISAILGVGVRISRIIFDFRYDIGLYNISKSVTYENINQEGEEEKSNIIFNRRNNILSFSLGFIF